MIVFFIALHLKGKVQQTTSDMNLTEANPARATDQLWIGRRFDETTSNYT